MVPLDKKQLRSALLKQRKNLDPQWRKQASQRIMQRVMPYLSEAKCIGIYVSDEHEVETHEFIKTLLKTHQVCCPLIVGEGIMEFHAIKQFTDLSEQHYHLLEPTNRNLIEASNIDVLLIPLVGFNRSLQRIGQGKGFYDRYLKGFQGKRIALAYAFQKCEFDADIHDEALDVIISEIEIYES